jgi:hypothetical protein
VTLKFRDDLTTTINVVVVPDQQSEPGAEDETKSS